MTETTQTAESAHQKLVKAVAVFGRAVASHEPGSAVTCDAGDQMELAAREVVREVEARKPELRPDGWDDNPVDGIPDDPSWLRHRQFTCGRCGETWGTNCQAGTITCPECEARLCSGCGRWEGEVI